MNILFAVRCPEDRKHYTAGGGVEYPSCGHMLAAYSDGNIYLRCPICKEFWKVSIDDLKDNQPALRLKRVPKELVIKLKTISRAVE